MKLKAILIMAIMLMSVAALLPVPATADAAWKGLMDPSRCDSTFGVGNIIQLNGEPYMTQVVSHVFIITVTTTGDYFYPCASATIKASENRAIHAPYSNYLSVTADPNHFLLAWMDYYIPAHESFDRTFTTLAIFTEQNVGREYALSAFNHGEVPSLFQFADGAVITSTYGIQTEWGNELVEDIIKNVLGVGYKYREIQMPGGGSGTVTIPTVQSSGLSDLLSMYRMASNPGGTVLQIDDYIQTLPSEAFQNGDSDKDAFHAELMSAEALYDAGSYEEANAILLNVVKWTDGHLLQSPMDDLIVDDGESVNVGGIISALVCGVNSYGPIQDAVMSRLAPGPGPGNP